MLRTSFAMVLAIAIASAPEVEAGALFDAAARGDTQAVQELLMAKGAADELGPNAETPLMAAALNDHPEGAKLLLAAGADVMARNKGGLTPLHAAAYGGSVGVARLLLDNGALLEDRENVAGATPLILAAEENRTEVAELLIAAGADIAVGDREGFTALTVAFWKRRDAMVRLLKSHGATCQGAEVLGSAERHRRCAAAGT